MPDWAGNQVSTDLITGVDLSEVAANQNVKSTLNDLFSVITKNITDGAVRFQEFTAPALSAAGEGSLYFDDTDKTFKGSRNGSAYDDLLFGNGANQQVAVFTSVIDTIAGYAPFYYNNTTTRLYITDASFAPTMEISKTGTTPALFKAFGGQGYASLGNWSATAAAPAYFNFYRGANGPAFPTSGMDIGSIRFRPASDTGDVPTTIGGARIDVRATENATLGVGGGVGLTIYTAANGQVSDTQRMLINSAGVVMLGVNSATITTNAGTDTKTVLGELTTYDSDAIHQIGNPSASDAKILVIQGNAAQTKALTEWQNSAGTFLFSIGAFGSHSYGGTTGIAVSAAGQGRIYFDSASNTFQVSQNGGAYVDLVNVLSPGGTTGSIQYNNGANLIDGDSYFLWDTASATIQIGAASVLSGKILLRNSTNANTLTIQPGTTGGNITFTLPTSVGSSGQYLQTDGAGVLSWQTVSGGGLTVGTTTIASGTVGRVLYEATGNVLGEAAGITYQTGASPTATITAQNATYVALRINSAATPSAGVFQVSADAGTTAHFIVPSTGGAIVRPTAASRTSLEVDHSDGTLRASLGVLIASTGFGALWLGSLTPADTNYSVLSDGSDLYLNAPGSTARRVYIRTGNFGAPSMAIFDGSVSGGALLLNTTTINAHLYAVSGATTRVGLRIDSAANSTVALNQFYLNADDTNAVALHSVFSVDSNGTAANGLGGQLQFQLESSTTNQQNAAAINWVWLDATHATRTAALQIQIVGNAAALATMAAFDVPTAAGDTAFQIYDLDNATLERVSVGAADSGGAGFKVLRIPN